MADGHFCGDDVINRMFFLSIPVRVRGVLSYAPSVMFLWQCRGSAEALQWQCRGYVELLHLIFPDAYVCLVGSPRVLHAMRGCA